MAVECENYSLNAIIFGIRRSDMRSGEFNFRHRPHVHHESFSSLGKHTRRETGGRVRALLFKYKKGCSLSWPSESEACLHLI